MSFAALGRTLGEITASYKTETARILKDAKEQFGMVVWTTEHHTNRTEMNIVLMFRMFNPNERLSVRIIAAMAFVENNLDFIEPREDEHCAIALSEFNQMAIIWMQGLVVLAKMENQLEYARTKNLRIKSILESKMAEATVFAMRFIIRAKTLVDIRGHSKGDNTPRIIVLGNSPPPAPQIPRKQDPSKPVADEPPAPEIVQSERPRA